MLGFFETVRIRHSVRKYQIDIPVEPEKLHAILEMACAAPSAGDLQAYRIFVISKQATRDSLAAAANNQAFISEAPVCLVFCTDEAKSEAEFGERGKRLYSIQDATIAAAYAQLAISAAGLGSTWVGFFDDKKISGILSLPQRINPVALISLGYPAEVPEASSRQPLDKVVVFDN